MNEEQLLQYEQRYIAVREQLIRISIPRISISIVVIAISLVLISSYTSRLALILSIMQLLYISRCFDKTIELKYSPPLEAVIEEAMYSTNMCMYASLALTLASLLNV